jgi:predicted PurR-regulated permease PerM
VDVTTHPFLHIIWGFFLIFLWVAWFFLLIRVVMDVFRRSDIGGGMKAVWVIVLLFLPLIGVLVYLITQGHHLAERDVESARTQQAEVDAYIRQTAGTGGPAAEIERAKALLDSGAIDQAEFDKIKAQALAS